MYRVYGRESYAVMQLCSNVTQHQVPASSIQHPASSHISNQNFITNDTPPAYVFRDMDIGVGLTGLNLYFFT